jgi:hypothetical protein
MTGASLGHFLVTEPPWNDVNVFGKLKLKFSFGFPEFQKIPEIC